MPLTKKGSEIMSALKKEYGERHGERVFYAMRNAGKISGTDSLSPELMKRVREHVAGQGKTS